MEEQQHIIVEHNSNNLRNEAFKDFMLDLSNSMNYRAKTDSCFCKNCTATELEQITVDMMKQLAPKFSFDATDIILVSGQNFPDIICHNDVYGVEVKSTQANHWTSTGSSILESTRNINVDKIYMLFGKLGGNPIEFKCRPYEECLYDIAVTHSPRYLIDMETTQQDTIFAKMGIPYNTLRTSSNSIESVRKYYRDKAKAEGKIEMPWWLGSENEQTTMMNLRLWKDVKDERLLAKILILFPEVLCSEFANVSLWLCSKYSIVLYNARDMFTAGGQCTKIDGVQLPIPLPHIVGTLINSAHNIKQLFEDKSFIEQDFNFQNATIIIDPYVWWLNKVDNIIRHMKNRKNGKTISEMYNLPLKKWFEDEVLAEFGK